MSIPAASIPMDPPVDPGHDAIVVLEDVAWDDYERLLAARGERSGPRLAFDGGALEIMSPGRNHERVKSYLGCLVEVFAEERGIDLTPLGSWTLKERFLQKGLEPDECYVLGEEEKEIPDLAIEVVWTRGRIDKLGIYAAIGVGEVWIWRSGTLRVYALGADGYAEVGQSRVLPGLDLQRMLEHLALPTATQAQRAWRRVVRGS
jgi:Uma2 family endonuclease